MKAAMARQVPRLEVEVEVVVRLMVVPMVVLELVLVRLTDSLQPPTR